MSEKKVLNDEELDKVTGGTDTKNIDFKYKLGQHIEQVILNLGSKPEDACTVGCTITKRGYKFKYGNDFMSKVYWLDVDGRKSAFSGWYCEDDISGNIHNWIEEPESGVTVVDQL